MLHPEALTRENSKWVLRYLPVDKRILIASCIPSLRITDKSTPVRIDYLQLNNTFFIADNVKHAFRTILQVAHLGELLPKDIRLKNQNGGVRYDVDKYGDEDTNLDMKEGDILIEGAWRFLTRIPRSYPTRLTTVLEFLLLLGMRWWGNSIKTTASTNTNENRNRSNTVVQKIKPRQEFTSYILNTITFLPTGEQKVIRLPDGFAMRDALRQYITKILGGTGVQFVKHLHISLFNGVLRLPKDLKLKIRTLSIRENPNVVIEAIKPILDDSSFPLGKLWIEVNSHKDKVFGNPILRSSASLDIEMTEKFNDSWGTLLMNLPNPIIRLSGKNIPMIEATRPIWFEALYPFDTLSIEVDDRKHPIFANEILKSSELLNIKINKTVVSSWADLLSNLTNPKIHLSGKTISVEDIVTIAKNWAENIENSRYIGSTFSMKCDTATNYFRRLEELEGAVRAKIPKDSKLVVGYTLPMNNSTDSELNIYKLKVQNYQEEMNKPDGQPFMIVMEVMPIGRARPITSEILKKFF